jgi:hypothetical protein
MYIFKLAMVLTIFLGVISLTNCGVIPTKFETQSSRMIVSENGERKTQYSRDTKGFSAKESSPVEDARANVENAKAEYIAALAKSINSGSSSIISTASNSSMVSATNSRAGNTQNIPDVRFVVVKNKTLDYAIEIKSEPFKGLHLGPGETSEIPKPLNNGIYNLVYTWYKLGSSSGNSYSGTNTVTVYIDKYTNFIYVK